MQLIRAVRAVAMLCVLGAATHINAAEADARALVRHAPTLNGTIEGSVQQMLPESVTLIGGARVTGDLLLPGTPKIRLNGKPAFGGTVDATGAGAPSDHQVTLNGGATLGRVVRRTDPVVLPTVSAPPAPPGTRHVLLNTPGQPVGDWSTVRNLTLNGNAGQIAVPPGTYGDFTANGGRGFTLGAAGSTRPSVYHFQRLTLNGQTRVRIVGRVTVIVANGFSANGLLGAAGNPEWLTLGVASGDFTLNGGATFYGLVHAPSGTVTINGNSLLVGGVGSDRLTVNGGGILRLITLNQSPTATPMELVVREDTPLLIALAGEDPEGATLTYTIITPPKHGTLMLDPQSPTRNAYIYTTAGNYSGEDRFTFKVNDGSEDSVPATVSIFVEAVNDRPIAVPLTVATLEDTPVALTLSGSDVETETLTFEIATFPAHGVLSGTGAERIYTPFTDFFGEDSFTYVASDGELSSEAVMVTITVEPRPDAPVAASQSVEADEDTPLPLTLTGSDADGDALTFEIVSEPQHGRLSGDAPNLLYTPNADYFGADRFSFRVSDGTLDSPPASVAVDVLPVNDPPEVDAGADQTVTLPSFGKLKGSATDVDGDSLRFTWSFVSGPQEPKFESPTSVETRVEFPSAGTYTLRLTAFDGVASAFDDVVVVVDSSNLVFRTYTTSADFDLGTRSNLNFDAADQLQLNESASAGHFLWVAVSSKGTIVKINTRTGQVEGEYRTAPSGQPTNPSRTTVDLRGAVWCANRSGNSVVHIGSVESGLWIDKNGNGQPDTSFRLGDVRAWSNAGGVDTNGGVSTAEDECIIHYVRTSSTGTRHVSVDRDNNVWVTGTGNRTFNLIDGNTGAILRTEGPVGYGGYGGLIDRNGVVWSTSSGSLLRWDVRNPLSGPRGENWDLTAGSSHYGLAIGPDGYVWSSTLGPNTVYKYAPDGTLVGQYSHRATAMPRASRWTGAGMFGSPIRYSAHRLRSAT